MGKDGPCYHCGVTSTPLWRNGPPEKPVLCNACGSRWRTKGTLANYTPLHARAEADDYVDPRVARVRTIPLEKRAEKIRKRKHSYENTVFGSYASDYNQAIQKSTDEDTCIRSSSGSAVSNSESYAQYSADTSDLTGPAQSAVWEAQVPSKKRTFMSRPKPSSVEKLTQDLCAILHEQRSCYPSDSFEEELLFESATPMVSVEIGHGGVLFKHPSSLVREEESEASSLSVENKYCASNEAYSHSSQMTQQEPAERDTSTHDRMQHFWNHNSPLCHIDLNDVINFEVLLGCLSSEEQQQLLKYLPSSDASQFPGNLRAMFGSSFFRENLSSFQQLLSEGVLSNSCSEAAGEDIKTLKRLALSSLTKSKWLKLYNELKGSKFNQGADYSVVGLGAKPRLPKDLGSAKRSYDELNQSIAVESQTVVALPTEGRHFMLDSHQFTDDSTDQDLLLDVPSNGFFPQAELLPISRFSAAESSSVNPSALGL